VFAYSFATFSVPAVLHTKIVGVLGLPEAILKFGQIALYVSTLDIWK